MATTAALLLSLLCSILCLLVLRLYDVYWSRPGKVLAALRRQGITGPPRSFPTGNVIEMKKTASPSASQPGAGSRGRLTENYASTLFPYFDLWRKEYGPVFAYTTLNIPALYVSDPDLVREIGLCVSLDLGKATHLQKSQEPLFGHGILKANGPAWVHQRKIISPEFFMAKVKVIDCLSLPFDAGGRSMLTVGCLISKGMVELIVEAAVPLLRKWESEIELGGGSADIPVDRDLRNFSADVISRACFGSSYSRGKDIFQTLRKLQKAISSRGFLFKVPHLRFLPFRQNREVSKLTREVRSLILDVVRQRKEEARLAPEKEKDLLQSILESAESDGFIVDNCKNIYFAGHDTTTVSATWCLMLLAAHPEWQELARREFLHVCPGRTPDAETLAKLKNLTMVIQETLRLFPPSPFVSREALRDMKFGELVVPEGTNIWIPITTMHHDRAIWGDDADEFLPERFANGVYRACKHPHAYMPFGVGARKCVGQNLALVELKIVLALILSRFRFELSPVYRHSPGFRLTVGPEFGLNLVIRKV